MMIEPEWDTLEQQLPELFSEIQSVQDSVNRLRECVSSEVSREAAARAACEEAQRAAEVMLREAAAAGALARRTAEQVLATRSEVAAINMQLATNECERVLLEDRCSELSLELTAEEQELRRLSLPNELKALQRAFVDLGERLQRDTDQMSLERSHLKEKVREAKRLASEDAELRSRARLAAAAHARERSLISTQRTHVIENLRNANAEIAHLKAGLAEAQQNCDNFDDKKIGSQIVSIEGGDTVDELRDELETVRMRSAELERKLSAVMADNVGLAVRLASLDNGDVLVPVAANTTSQPVAATNITATDSFLIE